MFHKLHNNFMNKLNDNTHIKIQFLKTISTMWSKNNIQNVYLDCSTYLLFLIFHVHSLLVFFHRKVIVCGSVLYLVLDVFEIKPFCKHIVYIPTSVQGTWRIHSTNFERYKNGDTPPPLSISRNIIIHTERILNNVILPFGGITFGRLIRCSVYGNWFSAQLTSPPERWRWRDL